MSRHTEAPAALLALLETVPGIPAREHWAEPNTEYEPKVGTPYCFVRCSPADEQRRSLPARNARMRLPGVLRVTLYRPLHEGEDTARVLGEAILDAFAPGTTLTNGATTVTMDSGRMSSGGRDIEPGWYTVPIDLRWHVDFINALP